MRNIPGYYARLLRLEGEIEITVKTAQPIIMNVRKFLPHYRDRSSVLHSRNRRSIAAHFIMPLKDCNFRNMQRPILKLPIESFSLYPVVSLLVKYPDETTSSEVVAIDKENGIEDRVSFKGGRIRNNSFG